MSIYPQPEELHQLLREVEIPVCGTRGTSGGILTDLLPGFLWNVLHSASSLVRFVQLSASNCCVCASLFSLHSVLNVMSRRLFKCRYILDVSISSNAPSERLRISAQTICLAEMIFRVYT